MFRYLFKEFKFKPSEEQRAGKILRALFGRGPDKDVQRASAVSFPDGIPVIIFRYGRPLSPNLISRLPIPKPHSLHCALIQLNST